MLSLNVPLFGLFRLETFNTNPISVLVTFVFHTGSTLIPDVVFINLQRLLPKDSKLLSTLLPKSIKSQEYTGARILPSGLLITSPPPKSSSMISKNSIASIMFKNAFNIDYIDSVHVVKAIAQFERTLISVNSKYDKWIRQELQLSPSELNGYVIFNSEKGDCFHCHGTEMFMDNLFHNNGLDSENFADLGLFNVSNDPMDIAKFKTPTLRNIEFTAPYMHDGRFETLEEVIEHYNSGGKYSPTVDPLMKKIGVGLQLTNSEKQDLVNFLKALSDYDYINVIKK